MLDRSKFSPSSGGKYLRPECRDCGRRLARERAELKKIYGPAPANHTCPICLKKEEDLLGIGGNAGVWVLDHDHKTNQFRGYICHNCNKAIGIFQDDLDRIDRAKEYLMRTRF